MQLRAISQRHCLKAANRESRSGGNRHAETENLHIPAQAILL